ncbi:cysteine hydrolase family protein [Penicillium chermesinum]|uniref:Cysteine hydrolase family protein n=1 Tax=Penicillium chermesinum TaxID=63820 RepID=A0A9W9NTX3_9EURO|nr:cysteine hydrolase family protein [Penicillium chermesinum]KAJ5226126.1 cysteine hydrolase family protein [Penicillium chermesinum]KAJ6160688.1 cysteine hydrolase family protein [Penicillium chermesinum]
MFKLISLVVLALAAALVGSAEVGYSVTTPSTVTNSSLSFGSHYAVLNLDLINASVGSVNGTAQGQAWIKNTAKWIDAVHSQSPPPISIFSRVYFSTHLLPEISANAPFMSTVAAVGNITESSVSSQIYPRFKLLPRYDVALQKTRFFAGADNALVQILRSQKIDTVIISGIRTSGVVLSTAMRLFDLDFKVYVIANNTIETGDDATAINNVILRGILPKMPLDVITIEQAIDALSRSEATYY